jgi:hypothetical protein
MAVQDELVRARQTAEEVAAEEHKFQEGFTFRTFLGLLFVAFVMLPGSIYMGLVAGVGLGAAAEWVTIVLFAEVMRRSLQPLRRQEIYMLYYIAASLTAMGIYGLSGGPLQWKIWDQFFVQSSPAAPIADQVPRWAVPAPDSPALRERTFLDSAWALPIFLLALTEILGRASWMSMGYLLFRMTSDVEKLPFPLAPVAASGALALAEAGSREESWRWGVFSTGAVVGMGFGLFYVGIPVFTGTLFGNALQLIPIPFLDLTQNVEASLPTAIVGISINLGEVLVGFVLPYHILLGAAISSVATYVVANPILYRAGLIPNWQPNSPALQTKLAADLDFWLAIIVGLQLAVAVIGVSMVVRTLREYRVNQSLRLRGLTPPPGRGDPPLWIPLAVWAVSVVSYIALCRWLVPDFPLWIVAGFGLLWSPLNSYVSARMVGLTGQGVSVPFIKEVAIISSRYPRVDIWYAPLPLYDHGWSAQRFREVELTGTKFTSILKAELVMLPVIFLASFIFWAFFWKASPIPSPLFPFAQKMWPYYAQMEAVWKQINLPQSEIREVVLNALNIPRIITGFVSGLGLFWLFSAFKWPILLFYGLVSGVGQLPHFTLPKLLGAWLGHRYFKKRYGEENWMRYAPVLLAGFFCGMGLIGMFGIALALVAKSVSVLPF